VAFAAAETVKATPSPPELRLTVSHDVREATSHDGWLVVTTVLTDPPPAARRPDETDKATACGPAAWVTVYVEATVPAEITTWPERAEDSGFAEAETTRVWLPLPDAGLADAHAGSDVTVQDARFAVTTVETDPPAAANEPDVGDTEDPAGIVAVTVYAGQAVAVEDWFAIAM
jgi:hypothetical protein